MTRRTLLVMLGVAFGHGLALELAWRTDFVSALLSPGAHSAWLALVFGAVFLVLRLTALVVLPPVTAAALVFLGFSTLERLRRRA